MRIIVGLGNPGSEYSGTRHNIGFDIADAAAAALGCRFRPGPGEYHAAEGTGGTGRFLLAKPQTYMNNSGAAVSDLLVRTGSLPEELVVISDDFHLPLGRLRLRLVGSGGGHNGLGSIITELGTTAFPRLRIGIAGATFPANARERKEYVLLPFDGDERSAVGELTREAARFVTMIIEEGTTAAQHRFHNTK